MITVQYSPKPILTIKAPALKNKAPKPSSVSSNIDQKYIAKSKATLKQHTLSKTLT